MKNDTYFKHFILNEDIIFKQHVDQHFVFPKPALHTWRPAVSRPVICHLLQNPEYQKCSNVGPKPFPQRRILRLKYLFYINFRYNFLATVSISIYLSGLEFSHAICKVICVQDPSRIFPVVYHCLSHTSFNSRLSMLCFH